MIDSLARLPAQQRHGFQGKDALIDLQVDDSGDSSPVRLAEPQIVGGSSHLALSKLHTAYNGPGGSEELWFSREMQRSDRRWRRPLVPKWISVDNRERRH